MKGPRLKVAIAVLAGLALVAGACGSGGGSDNSTQATVDPGIKSGVAAALGGSTTAAGSATTAPAKDPASWDEWEKLATTERAAVVQKIKDNKWGKSADGKTVTGPAGFTIDLSKCPAGWSDTEGLSDTEIKIGHTTAQSGTLADYGNIPKAMNLVYDYYAAKGAFTDSNGKNRKINLLI
ncbi:MAG: branched-chain amino acid transport system substrate-binding protein, partial [Acidimicrobiia bacterium]|nr:branched-chain amino acid transport system substrate-binding protein [Acidimicrobiia bacterium]